MYNPPSQSKYLNEDEIMNLEMEITSHCSQYKYIILIGDINARTAELRDYTVADNFIADFFYFETETLEFFDQQSKLISYGVQVQRRSQDRKTNNNGFKLLEICKNINLFIVNGRIGKDKTIDKLTFRDISLIDYTICSVEMFPFIKDFEVIELDSIYSDGHSLVLLSLNIPRKSERPDTFNIKQQIQPQNKPKWKPTEKNTFVQNIDLTRIDILSHHLDTIEISKESMNYCTGEISRISLTSINKSFRVKCAFCGRNRDKPWYGFNCKSARKRYMKEKSDYHKQKTIPNKTNLTHQRKVYKKTMNKYISKYRKEQEQKLRHLQSKNPKEYWRYLNSLHKNKHTDMPQAECFLNYYKNIDKENDHNETFSDDFSLNHLNTLIETLKNQKKKLFCAFIDFSQAFNNVWRIGLWRKLLGSTVQGKFLRVIYNMYSGIKSCVSVNNECSGYFISNLGVRQGENLSPVLFCIYLNDLEDYLSQNRDFGVATEYQSEEMFTFVKIGVLLYADDTILLAESEHGLQYSIDIFIDYCRAWKLKINHSKSKVVIFGARNVSHFKFYIGELLIETTDHYKYLCVYFSKSGSFLYAKKNIVE